jgi:hypothetical protein
MPAIIELLIKLFEKLLKTNQLSRNKRRRTNQLEVFTNGLLTAFLAFEIILFSLLVAYSVVHVP